MSRNLQRARPNRTFEERAKSSRSEIETREFKDTSAWNGISWVQLTTARTPSARDLPTLASHMDGRSDHESCHAGRKI